MELSWNPKWELFTKKEKYRARTSFKTGAVKSIHYFEAEMKFGSNLYIFYLDKTWCRCLQKRIEALGLSRKPAQWKPSITYIIPICIIYNYYPIWVKFRIRDLPTTLSNISKFRENLRLEGSIFHVSLYEITFTRVPWEVTEFLRQTKSWQSLGNASRSAPFAILSRDPPSPF